LQCRDEAHFRDREQVEGAGNTTETGPTAQTDRKNRPSAIANPDDANQPLDLLLIAGVPLHEPVVRYGPFVMNTEAEIIQAIDDYRMGRMGQIHA
jgi:redox-sensitive bicupin YhaK (pirin superfamily)